MLYCARHTFGTAAYEATANLRMVMNAMGHTDAICGARSGLFSVRAGGRERAESRILVQSAFWLFQRPRNVGRDIL